MNTPLAGWDSFYVMIGSSAAALSRLQFVVIALVAESEALRSLREIDAFGTPTVVHFCAVLLVSAMMSAPWRALSTAGVALGASGLAGVVYVGIVARRARLQTGYEPVLEDWIWHAVLPFIAYAALAAAALLLLRHAESALFLIGAAALLLLFIGIHNAWDSVTYIAVERWHSPKQGQSDK